MIKCKLVSVERKLPKLQKSASGTIDVDGHGPLSSLGTSKRKEMGQNYVKTSRQDFMDVFCSEMKHVSEDHKDVGVTKK